MLNFESLFLFCFIFSVLNVLRTCFRLISALLQANPQQFVLGSRELIILGISISYALTYIIKG